ncbi:MAG: aldo/keto reductase [Propionibacteriaceae bacterium]|nr:aldo/keto reductase [Propionibacteriaceae bacterium]
MIPEKRLQHGTAIPQVGFGTYKIAPQDAEAAVATALELGHRHIDTAAMYGNEVEVGRALARSGLARDELFVTSKLDNPYHEPDAARAAFERSLSQLGLEFLDLYLIHWPLAATTDYVATWRALVEIQASGRAREVGVSNFQPDHLRAVIGATGVTPAVNQVEINPYLTQEPLRALHAKLGILTQAWSPLARGRVLADPVVGALARGLGRTPAQVVLRWHLQRGDVVFPKSTHRARIAENLAVLDFELDADAMAAISGLNRDERSGSDPDKVELGNR